MLIGVPSVYDDIKLSFSCVFMSDIRKTQQRYAYRSLVPFTMEVPEIA